MTSSIKLMRTMIRQKSSSVHKVIGLQLLALVITLIIQLWQQGHINAMDPVGFFASYGMLATMVIFVLLALRTEHIWTNSVFRLIPITDTRLYISNLLSTFLNFVYFLILETIITGLLGSLDLADFNMPNTSHLFGYVTSGLALIFTLLLVGWTFISMVHLLGKMISTFLPETKQGFIQLVLYIVVFFLLFFVLSTIDNTIGNYVNNFFSPVYSMGTLYQIIGPLFILSGFMLLWVILFSLINIYLLKYWTEAK